MHQVNPLILVDGSQYMFRSYHATRQFYTSKGIPTNAIRGVTMMLRKLVRENPTATVAVIFDAPGKTFRDDLFSAYKANRPPLEEEMRLQIDAIHTFVEALGLPLLIVPGVEADDVIGTLATQATALGRDTLISSNDKDFAQLVNAHVRLEDSEQGGGLDEAGVQEKFQVAPNQIVDYLALMGDKADNIPGVPGVGKKTAAKWLQEHGDLDTVIEKAGEVKGKIGERLRENLGKLPLSRELATIKCDVEMSHSAETLEHSPRNYEKLIELCHQYEFRTLREMFEEDMGSPSGQQPEAEVEVEVEVIHTTEQLAELKQALIAAGSFAMFAANSTTSTINHQINALGFCVDPDKAWYIPLTQSFGESNLSVQDSLDALAEVFANPELTVVAHDIKRLRHTFQAHGVQIRTSVQDVMLMSYVLNSIALGEHRLKSIAASVLDRAITDEGDLLGTGAKRIEFSAADPETLKDYVTEQVTTIRALVDELNARLEKTKALQEIYDEVEKPLEPYLWSMEHHGTLVEPSVLETLNEELETRRDALLSQAYEEAGHEFNLRSPKQLAVVLYDELELKPPKASKSGARTTNEDYLSTLTGSNPLPQIILDYRATTKLMDTYIAGLTREINPATRRIHTSFSQANASTGRLASVNPNLQNIPIRTAEGRRVREAFIAPEGHVLLTADYSQIELRVMAHITNDPGLTEAFSNGLDIHQATAAEVFGLPMSLVNEDQRRSAKAINFGLMYGMSAFGLARTLDILRPEAQRYIDAYFSRYPSVQNYVQASQDHGREHGYVETIYGRRIYLRDINARNHMVRAAAERLAINAPVQGSAADIIKKATIKVGQWLAEESDLDIAMILQVHDELVFEVAETDLPVAQAHIPELMRTAVELNVPIEVDLGVADNWSAAH